MIPLPRLLDSSLNEVKRLHPVKVSISENIVPLSSASMQLPSDEQIPERSYVELFTVNGSAGIYIAKKPQDNYGNHSSAVNLEHAVSDVGKWIIKADIEKVKKTLSQALTQIFAYYGGNKWQLGTVSVNADVILSASYGDNLLSKMNSLIACVSSAMMTFDFSTSPWTINVVSRGTTVQAEGRLSRNIITATVSKDDSELCTRVYVHGLGTSGAVGYLDADTISTYGIIEGYISGDTYTAEQAGIVAQQYLDAHKRPKYSVDISMLDFYHATGETLDKVALGKLYRLVIPDDNVTIEENIITISWEDVYGSPEQVTITLSEEETTLSTFLEAQTSLITSAIAEGLQHIEKKDAEWTTKFDVAERSISALVQKTGIDSLGNNETLYSKITMTESSIETVVSKTGINSLGQEETLYSRISQTASSIETVVSKTGINSLGQSETLYSKISQNVDNITTLVSKTGINSLGQSETLYSKISQNVDSITSLVSKTGVNSLGQSETLYSKITQTATDITSLVTKTGVNSLGQSETLYSKISQNATSISTEVTRATTAEGTLSSSITQNATDITALVTKTGVNSLGQSETLYSKISQNATNISTEVTRATTAEGTLSSSISQNATDITALVTKTGVNSLGQSETLYSKISANATSISAEVTRATGAESTLSGQITAQASKISLVVTESSGGNVINSAGIVAAINNSGSSVKINASKINLAGNVSITDLSEYNSQTTGGTLSVQHNLYVGGFISCGVSGMHDTGMIVGSHLQGVNGISMGSHYFSLGYIYAAGDVGESPAKHNVVFWT